MEKERADKSVGFCVSSGSSDRLRFVSARQRGFSPIFVTAGVSLAVLLAVGIWQIGSAFRERGDATSYVAMNEGESAGKSAEAATSTLYAEDGTTPIGSAVLDGIVAEYLDLQERGLYTQEVAEKTAEKMAEGLVVPLSYRTYAAADIETTADTSYARMLAYRSDLQASLAPLLKNTEPEYEIFGTYVLTNDAKHLEKLRAAAQNYRAAAGATARVAVPRDALSFHLAILNALEQFAAALNTLAANADDPLAAVVVLRAFNQAETNVLTSFASLAKYYREKQT